MRKPGVTPLFLAGLLLIGPASASERFNLDSEGRIECTSYLVDRTLLDATEIEKKIATLAGSLELVSDTERISTRKKMGELYVDLALLAKKRDNKPEIPALKKKCVVPLPVKQLDVLTPEQISDAAQENLDALVSSETSLADPEIYKQVVALNIILGQWPRADQALFLLKTGFPQHKETATAFLWAVAGAMRQGRLNEARFYLNQAEDLASSFFKIRFLRERAELELRQGKALQAIKYAARLAAIGKKGGETNKPRLSAEDSRLNAAIFGDRLITVSDKQTLKRIARDVAVSAVYPNLSKEEAVLLPALAAREFDSAGHGERWLFEIAEAATEEGIATPALRVLWHTMSRNLEDPVMRWRACSFAAAQYAHARMFSEMVGIARRGAEMAPHDLTNNGRQRRRVISETMLQWEIAAAKLWDYGQRSPNRWVRRKAAQFLEIMAEQFPVSALNNHETFPALSAWLEEQDRS